MRRGWRIECWVIAIVKGQVEAEESFAKLGTWCHGSQRGESIQAWERSTMSMAIKSLELPLVSVQSFQLTGLVLALESSTAFPSKPVLPGIVLGP